MDTALVLRALFYVSVAYSVGYACLWAAVRLYVIWYMANGGL
jgi:hypothetical protein